MVGADPVSDPKGLVTSDCIFIVAVADDAIGEVVDQIDFNNNIVVHTSGSIGIDVLKYASGRYGVFYPLQTFSKVRDIDFSEIPICIEASSPEVEKTLVDLGGELSGDVRLIDSQQRVYIHLAAVFASNFANYMYYLGEDILKKHGISFDILKPLIRETAEKMEHKNPREAQTGPAVRRDMHIIQKHIDLLADDNEKRDLYAWLSRKILDIGK